MTTLRTFELLEQIGAGTTGRVFRARQTTLDRTVAVKLLHPHLANDDELVRSFEHEAKTAATLQQENIVAVIDFGRQGDEYLLAMEYVDGVDLKGLIAQAGRIPLPVAMSVAIDALRGLAHAHFRGVVHRDIKPANIMVSRAGIAKIADFSTAKLMTGDNELSGSPAYMSPEQAQGLTVDARSDLFSLGVALHEMLAGAQPFRGADVPAVLQSLVTTTPPDLHEVDRAIPESVARVVRRALEKDPKNRYAQATDFLRDLEQVCRDEHVVTGRVFVVDFVRNPGSFRERAKEAPAAKPAAEAPVPAAPSAWLGIRAKWTLASAAALALAMIPAGYLSIDRVRASMTESAHRSGNALAQQMADFSTEAVLNEDDLAMARAVDTTMRQEGVRYAVMLAPDGTVLASSGAASLAGEKLPEMLGSGEAAARVLGVDGSHLFHSEAPVEIRAKDRPPVVVGHVRVGYSFAKQTGEIKSFVVTQGALNAAGLALAMLLCAILARQFSRPILALSLLARRVATGDFRVSSSNLRHRRDEIGFLAQSFDQMAAFLQRGQFLRHAFERYVSPELADFIDKNPTALAAGSGERRDVTVLFLDIRDFTGMSEKMSAEDIVEFLVSFFNRMSGPVFECEGSIDKFIGDAMMAVFGFPVSHTDDPLRAVTAAIRMQELVAVYNRERAEKGLPPVKVGIGINSGSVVAGNMGCDRKLDYTVIGDPVNVASRLAGRAAGGQVLISHATYERVGARIAAESLGAHPVKGREERVEIYEVRSLVSEAA